MKHLLITLIVMRSFCDASTIEEVFDDIYCRGVWSADGFSLGNSEYSVNKEYVAFLQRFMNEKEVHSVVDIGCGDWQFSRHIDWSGIDYKGYDVVKYVVDRNCALYNRSGVEFIHSNVLEEKLPEADLVICKDVFQHLPNHAVMQLLEQFKKYKHCLITDYVSPGPFVLNSDIGAGGYRPLDLTMPPFSVEGRVVFKFQTRGMMKQVVHIGS